MKNSTRVMWISAGVLVFLLVAFICITRIMVEVQPEAAITVSGDYKSLDPALDARKTSTNILLVKSRNQPDLAVLELASGQSRVLELKDFHSLSLSGSWDISVNQGDAWQVEVFGPSQTGKEVRIDLLDDTLKLQVHDQGNPHSYSGSAVRLVLTMPRIDQIESSGTFNLQASGLAQGDMRLACAGAGSLVLSGKARDVDYQLSGTWNVEAAGLQTASSNISASGAGSLNLDAADADVQGQISGAVNVVLHGNPRSQGIQASGISSVQVR